MLKKVSRESAHRQPAAAAARGSRRVQGARSGRLVAWRGNGFAQFQAAVQTTPAGLKTIKLSEPTIGLMYS
jgi:hypothetical protein